MRSFDTAIRKDSTEWAALGAVRWRWPDVEAIVLR